MGLWPTAAPDLHLMTGTVAEAVQPKRPLPLWDCLPLFGCDLRGRCFNESVEGPSYLIANRSPGRKFTEVQGQTIHEPS